MIFLTSLRCVGSRFEYIPSSLLPPSFPFSLHISHLIYITSHHIISSHTKSSTVAQFHYLILKLTLGVKGASAPKVCGLYKHEIVDSCTVSLPHIEAHSRCQKRECSKSVRPLQARHRRQCTVSLLHTEAHSRCQKSECSKSVRPLQARSRRQLRSFTTSC